MTQPTLRIKLINRIESAASYQAQVNSKAISEIFGDHSDDIKCIEIGGNAYQVVANDNVDDDVIRMNRPQRYDNDNDDQDMYKVKVVEEYAELKAVTIQSKGHFLSGDKNELKSVFCGRVFKLGQTTITCQNCYLLHLAKYLTKNTYKHSRIPSGMFDFTVADMVFSDTASTCIYGLVTKQTVVTLRDQTYKSSESTSTNPNIATSLEPTSPPEPIPITPPETPAQGLAGASLDSLVDLDDEHYNKKPISYHMLTTIPPEDQFINCELFHDDLEYIKDTIPGITNEIIIQLRNIFATRLIPHRLALELNIKHSKGIVLHGPPGIGKTLLARSLSKVIKSKSLKIINGPELLSKFNGQSEANIRDVFKEAIEDSNKNRAGIHFIVFDEFESVAPVRRERESGDTITNNMVNQILTLLDGVQGNNNVFIVAITNNLKSIDPAILRPGRLETHIEMKLPDAVERRRIFNLYLKPFRDTKRLQEGVVIDELIKQSDGYSGSLIESIVRNASAFAFQRYRLAFLERTLKCKSTWDIPIELTMDDLRRAMSDIVELLKKIDVVADADDETDPVEHIKMMKEQMAEMSKFASSNEAS
ncbi:N-ethylmaleimide-sensitive factor AAA ATPase [uncultured virus]|nr:N-ethylmaleimide-sensitive factor AAA ATPase [uncultured virus]